MLVVELDLTLELVAFEIGDELVDDGLERAVVGDVEERMALMQQNVAFRTVCVLFQILNDAFLANFLFSF